jgi:hypothetical protein
VGLFLFPGHHTGNFPPFTMLKKDIQ